LTGISHFPIKSEKTPPFCPLMVGIHGGSCTAHHYDVDSKHTASLASAALGVPFVAFNRPNYKDSPTFLPLPEGTTYLQEEGKWEHELIFPALWEHFGKPNGCTGIVAMCHSMAVPGAIIAAALYARDATPKYPLAGLILSGYGTQPVDRTKELTPPPGTPPPGRDFGFVPEVKQVLMLSDPNLNCYDPEVVKQMPVQEHKMMTDELIDLRALWFTYWKKYADEVTVPIMYALGEHDWLWHGNKEHAQDFMGCFPKSERVEGGIVAGGPHALEWWWGSKGWYARCFGWGSEACTGLALKKGKQ
jgi:hypothetical protein